MDDDTERLLVHGDIVLAPEGTGFKHATVHVILENTTYGDQPAIEVARARIEDTAVHGPESETVSFAVYGRIDYLTGSYSLSIHVDCDNDGRVSPGDYINMIACPVRIHECPSHVSVLVEEVH